MKRAAGLLMFVLVFAAACGEEKSAPPPRPTATPTIAAAPTTTTAGAEGVVDMIGRAVVVPGTVERVVAMSPSAVDFALVLGLEVIGRPTDSDNPEAAGAAEVGSSLSPDYNAIAELAPDLVIADAAFHAGSTRDFEQFPYPVFVIEVRSYEGVFEVLEELGGATEREAEADEAAESIRDEVDAAIAAAGDLAGRALVLSGSGRDVYAASQDTYVGSLLAEIGVENAYGESAEGAPLPGFGILDLEQLGSDIPGAAEAILVLPAGPGESIVSQVQVLPAWAASPAVAAGKVVELNIDMFLRAPGPTAPQAIATLLGHLSE